MRNVLTVILFFISSQLLAQPPVINRGSGSITPFDQNLFIGKSFKLPTYTDTAAANTSISAHVILDSCGAKIFTYNGGVNQEWTRFCTSNGTKKWVKIANQLDIDSVKLKQPQIGTIAYLRSLNAQTDVMYQSTDGVFQDIGINNSITDDGAIYVRAANNHVYKRLIFGGVIEAAWFGVKADGVTNDLPALINCYNATYNSPYRIIQLPSGQIKTTDTWYTYAYNNITIRGRGSDKNVEAGGYQPSVTTFVPTFTDRPVIQTGTSDFVSKARSQTIENIYFHATSVPTSSNFIAVRFMIGSGHKLMHCKADGFYSGFSWEGSIESSAEDCLSSNCAISYNIAGNSYSGVNVFTISKCYANSSNIAYFVYNTTGVVISGCHAESISSQAGIYTGPYTQGVALHDITNHNLQMINFYIEGADYATLSNNSLPSYNTLWNGVYFINHLNYVWTQNLRGEFGTINDGTTLNSVYIAHVDTALSNGTYASPRGKITIRGNNTLTGIRGGYIRGQFDTCASTSIINCVFGYDLTTGANLINKNGGIFIESPAKSSTFPVVVGKYDKYGLGSPISNTPAFGGAIYRRIDGSAGTTVYINTSGNKYDSTGAYWKPLNDWTSLINTPTTVSGYGIIDAEVPITFNTGVTRTGNIVKNDVLTGANIATQTWIGSTQDSAKLVIKATTGIGGKTIQIGRSATGLVWDENNSRLTQGNVTTPSFLSELWGAATFAQQRIKGTSSVNGGGIYVENDVGNQLKIEATGSTNASKASAAAIYTSGLTSLDLGGGRGTPALTIISSNNTVGIGGTPSSSAILDVASTSKGVLIPRMTIIQRDAITSPADGLQIFNTDQARLNIYSTTLSAWRATMLDGLTTKTYAATTNIDFNAARMQTVSLTGDITLTTSNIRLGSEVELRVISDASSRNLTFPAGWTFMTNAAPASIAASKTGLLILRSFGTTDANIIASWVVQP